MTRSCTVVCALGAAALLAGCAGSRAGGGDEATTVQRPAPPPRVYKVQPPPGRVRIRPFRTRTTNGMRCSYRLFSDGSGQTTVQTCFLGH